MPNFYKIAFGESGRGAQVIRPQDLASDTSRAGNEVGWQKYREATGTAPMGNTVTGPLQGMPVPARDPSNPEVQLGNELQAQRNNPLTSGRPTDEQMNRMREQSRQYWGTAKPRTPEQVAEWEKFTNEGKPVYDYAAQKWTMPGAAVPTTQGVAVAPKPRTSKTDWAGVAQQNWAANPPAAAPPPPANAGPATPSSIWESAKGMWGTANNLLDNAAKVNQPAPAPVPGVSGVTATPPAPAIKPPTQVVGTSPTIAKSQAIKPLAPGMDKHNSAEPTWYSVIKVAVAPSMEQLQALSQSLKGRLEGITHDRVQGNAELNARLDLANKALDSTSKSPEIGPGTSYVRNAGQAAVYENQHNVTPSPLTYSQLERQAAIAGAGSQMLSNAGKLGLTMPGRGEQLNGVEKPTSDPRVQGARLVEAIAAAKRLGLPFTAEHFVNGYVNPETVLHEDAKRSIPSRKAPSLALPYVSIPFTRN